MYSHIHSFIHHNFLNVYYVPGNMVIAMNRKISLCLHSINVLGDGRAITK